MVKLVYTYALGAYAERCAGSSPVAGTKPSSVLKSLVKDVFKRFLPSEGDLIFVVNF